MYLLAVTSKADLIAKGIWNALKAIPVAVWRTHPRYIHGYLHASYTITWLVIVILIVVAVLRFARSR